MDLIPDQLFRLTPRDIGNQYIEPYLRKTVLSAGGSTQVNADWTLTQSDLANRWLVLRAICARAAPGGGQNVVQGQIQIIANGNSFDLTGDGTATGANVSKWITWIGGILLPPGVTLRAAFFYNAFVAANQSEIYVHGVLIPRGNISQ